MHFPQAKLLADLPPLELRDGGKSAIANCFLDRSKRLAPNEGGATNSRPTSDNAKTGLASKWGV